MKKRKKSQCSKFLKNPYRIARSLLEEKKSGALVMTKEDFEDHVKSHMPDTERHLPLGSLAKLRAV